MTTSAGEIVPDAVSAAPSARVAHRECRTLPLVQRFLAPTQPGFEFANVVMYGGPRQLAARVPVPRHEAAVSRRSGEPMRACCERNGQVMEIGEAVSLAG